MTLARRLAFPTVAWTVLLAVLLVLHPIATARSFAIWLLLLTATVLFALVRDVARGDSSVRGRRFETELRRRPRAPGASVELLRMERELELGVANADAAHRRLLPLLRAAAAARLASRHGVDLARSPEAARELLGEEAWDVLRPDRPRPDDRRAPGFPHRVLVATIESVEAL